MSLLRIDTSIRAAAVAAGNVAQEERSPEQREAVALAEALAGDLAADLRVAAHKSARAQGRLLGRGVAA